MLTRKIGGRGSAAQTYTTTVITSSTTFVASGAGVYRVFLVGGGGTGEKLGSTPRGSGGSGFLAYGEFTLTASENVSVTIGAGITNTGVPGANGNPTIFGSYLTANGGGAGGPNCGGAGFSGGNGLVNDGGADGANATAGGPTGAQSGRGQGPELLDFIASRFGDVTIEPATAGANNGGGRGVLVNGTEYGRAGFGSVANSVSFAGVLLVGVPS